MKTCISNKFYYNTEIKMSSLHRSAFHSLINLAFVDEYIPSSTLKTIRLIVRLTNLGKAEQCTHFN